jgi:hypothetical protein
MPQRHANSFTLCFRPSRCAAHPAYGCALSPALLRNVIAIHAVFFLAQRQVHARSSENLMLLKFNAHRQDVDLFVIHYITKTLTNILSQVTIRRRQSSRRHHVDASIKSPLPSIRHHRSCQQN